MIIYRHTDRIPVKIGDVSFLIAPLTFEQRTEIVECIERVGGEDRQSQMKIAGLCIKFGVKDCNGVQDCFGNKWELQFDDSGNLTDECIGELYQLDCAPGLVALCNKFAVDSIKDHKIDGVQIDFKGITNIKKKSKSRQKSPTASPVQSTHSAQLPKKKQS